MVQQRTYLRMFTYDRPPIGWRVRNLPGTAVTGCTSAT